MVDTFRFQTGMYESGMSCHEAATFTGEGRSSGGA